MHADHWQTIWREGLAPCLTRRALEALAQGLRTDDAALIQQATVLPAWESDGPARDVDRRPIRAACALGYAGWKGEGLTTVGAVQDFFQELCDRAEERLRHPAATRFFTNWFDDTPRVHLRSALLAEVERSIAERATVRPDSEGAP